MKGSRSILREGGRSEESETTQKQTWSAHRILFVRLRDSSREYEKKRTPLGVGPGKK